jgi:hypothetical protein
MPVGRFSILGGRLSPPPGGAKQDRTADLLTASQALSQLSYGPGNRCKRERGANTSALAPPGISIVIVTFVARSLRPNGWLRGTTRSAGSGARLGWRIWRRIQAHRHVPGVRGRCGVRRGSGSRRSARCSLARGHSRQLGAGLPVLSGDDEHDSGYQEQAEAEQREPQRSRRLFERGRRVMVVVVLVVLLPVTVRFVRITVATHGAAYFRFSSGGQADLRKILDFPYLCRGFGGLTLLGRGP